MKKLFILLIISFLTPITFAQQNCNISEEKPIRLLTAELERGMPVFKKLSPPVYYLSYSYEEHKNQYINVQYGGVVRANEYDEADLSILVRVGDLHVDNTRLLKNDRNDFQIINKTMPIIRKDSKAFSTAVWKGTFEAVDEAQMAYDRVQTDNRISSERADNSDDFVMPPTEKYCHNATFHAFDMERIKQLLLKASQEVRGKDFILDSSFTFEHTQGYRYFVDSNATQLKFPQEYTRLSFSLLNKTKEGLILEEGKIYDVSAMDELPSEETLLADIRSKMELLKQLTSAPDAEPISVPTILKNKATGVFVHEVLGHRLEGYRQKDDDFGKTFTAKIGQEILPPFLSLVADPTIKTFQGQPMRGAYEFDDEGVRARPVVLVENGVLKNFLMSSTPVKGFPVSNGHGRSDREHRSVSRMSHLVLTSSKTVPYEELERQMLEEVKKQGKPYGVIIEGLSGGYTMVGTSMPQVFKLKTTEMYRLYPDGRKELVRGGEISGTPLVSFNEIIAASDDYDVFNGACGSVSGWVPQSEVAPSVLLRRMEIETQAKNSIRLPILKSPYAEAAK